MLFYNWKCEFLNFFTITLFLGYLIEGFDLWYNGSMHYPKELPFSKRFFDLVITIPGLILLSPFLLITALLIRLTLGNPVLFRQVRPGYKGALFEVYKFRTMTDAHDEAGNLLSDEFRLTRLGRFLRGLSIDEFPELINVLRGEMSLVGPRPLLVEYLERYSDEQARRHDVLPGISGWAQVNGRNAITWQDKFCHDVWYVDNWSLWLDIKILIMTPLKVIQREGINREGYATAPVFQGNEGWDPESDE